ncbi:MAG: lamin tail domain-containing protein, partial [Planctomycetales bacterium]|nr:lamin tail domain-containing protein [Planctomycetales bacterium]
RQVLSSTPWINEFMASNSSTLVDGDGASSDWIEIYNPTATAIDLGGWHLTDSASNPTKWTFPTVSLNAGEYLVVFASNQATPDYVDGGGNLHTTFALSAGGEYLALTDSTGAVVQEFAPEFPAQSTDVSYGLDAAQAETYFSVATPGAANAFGSAYARGVSFTEIMYHPSTELDADEYLELYNSEAAAINLTGWTLSGGVNLTLPAVTINPGEYLVIAADTAAFAAKYPTVSHVTGGWTGALSNSAETIRLSDDLGRQVDVVSYADEGDWSFRELGPLDRNHRGWVWNDAHDGGGSSLELVNLNLPNDEGQNWRASSVVDGTPGAANSQAATDSAPLIVDVQQTPIIPHSTDSVVVSARLIDESASGLAATLHWRVDGAASFTTVPMTETDGRFTASLPAQANGTVVEYYVSASDAGSLTRTYPSATQPSGQQLTNLLYQVDNSFDPQNLPAAGDMPIYRLIMTEAERAEIAQIGSSSSDRLSSAKMNGTFISVSDQGVEARYQVSIRNRGVSSSTRKPNSYHIDVPQDQLWHGVHSLNLNTQFTNSQLAGLSLFKAAGLIAEDAQPIRALVNGVDLTQPTSPSYGVYIQLEASDHYFAENHFPEDSNGNLYRVLPDASDRRWGDLRDLGSDPAAYAPFYEKRTNASEGDYSDVIELVDVLNNTPDELYYDRVSQVVDIDQWLGYFATIAIMGSEETMLATGSGDDYMLYRGVDDPRFLLIPHDFDTLFGQGDTAGSPTGSIYRATSIATLDRFLNHPEIAPAYHAKLKSLLETTFSQAQFDPMIDELLGGFTPTNVIDSMKTFLNERRDYILGLVDAPLTASAVVPTLGGVFHTEEPLAAVRGTAPLAETTAVTVNGLAANYEASTGQWQLGEAIGGVQ